MSTKLIEPVAKFMGPADTPVLDTSRMSARFVFTTSSVDRVGDRLRTLGIDTTAHRANPVILWDHGNWFSDPIGKALDPLGNYTVELTENVGYQTTYFLPTQLGEQYYSLVEMGGVNCNSIGYRTLKSHKNQHGGLDLEAVELVEISLVAVPANGECVRAFLSKDKICGKSLHPSLRRALEAQLPIKPSTTVTAGFEGFTMKAVQIQKGLAKAAINAAKKAETPEAPADEPKDEATPDATAAGKEQAPAEPEAAAELPQGAELLRATHEHLKALVEHYDQELPKLESEEVADAVLTIAQETLETLGTIEAMYAEQYPEAPALEGAVGSTEGEEEAKDTTEEEAPAEPAEDEAEEPAAEDGAGSKSYQEDADEADELEAEFDALSPTEQKAFIAELELEVSKQDAAERRAALVR